MWYFVYILLSLKDRKFYIGYTEYLEKRLKQHIDGRVASTRFRRPFKLLHYEAFVDQRDAEAREKFLKSGAGHTQLQAKLKRTLAKDYAKV